MEGVFKNIKNDKKKEQSLHFMGCHTTTRFSSLLEMILRLTKGVKNNEIKQFHIIDKRFT